MFGATLAARRRAEAERAAATFDIESEVWDNPDGRLTADLFRRERVIRAIRRFEPDLVLTHRANDYHPDHRATSQLVQDAAYLLTVPAICPDVPHLRRDPVMAYLADAFTKPCRFEPTVIIDIEHVWDDKISMLHEHRSQFYEWLPYNGGYEDDVPADDRNRRIWLSAFLAAQSERQAEGWSGWMQEHYGYPLDRHPRRIEAFEASEYGTPLDDEALARLFPFVPRFLG